MWPACYEYYVERLCDTDLVGMHLISTCSSYPLTHRHTRTRALGVSQRLVAVMGGPSGTSAHAHARTEWIHIIIHADVDAPCGAGRRRGREKTLCCITHLAHVLHSRTSGATTVCRCTVSTGRPFGAPLLLSTSHIAVCHKYLQVIPSEARARASVCAFAKKSPRLRYGGCARILRMYS